ncbi:MAG: tail fiber domain-containing protein [Chromatocurvus sp.]
MNDAGVALQVSDIQFFGSCAADGNESDDPDCALGEVLEDGDRCQIEVTCNVANGSDIRLKTDISRIGVAANGLPLYRFRYKTGAQYYQGVMAQDVLGYMPEAVLRNEEGYYMVRYDMLGMTMRRVD